MLHSWYQEKHTFPILLPICSHSTSWLPAVKQLSVNVSPGPLNITKWRTFRDWNLRDLYEDPGQYGGLSSGQRFCLFVRIAPGLPKFQKFCPDFWFGLLFFLKFVWISRISSFPKNAEKMTLKEILNNANNYGTSNACNCLLEFCRVWNLFKSTGENSRIDPCNLVAGRILVIEEC